MPTGAAQALGWGLACLGVFLVYDTYRNVNPVKDLGALVSGGARPTAEQSAFTTPLALLIGGGTQGGGSTTITTTGSSTESTALTIPAGGDPTGKRAIICNFALSKVGGQYVWGGNGPKDYDCSGLFHYAYAAAGLVVTRLSGTESLECVSVANPEPGDAVFYGHPAEHVGVYLGGGQMVAADHPDAGGPGVGILHEAVYPTNGAGGPAVWYGRMNALAQAERKVAKVGI